MSLFHSIVAEDVKAEHEDGSSTLLMLLLNYLHSLSFAKCSTGRLGIFCANFFSELVTCSHLWEVLTTGKSFSGQ